MARCMHATLVWPLPDSAVVFSGSRRKGRRTRSQARRETSEASQVGGHGRRRDALLTASCPFPVSRVTLSKNGIGFFGKHCSPRLAQSPCFLFLGCCS